MTEIEGASARLTAVIAAVAQLTGLPAPSLELTAPSLQPVFVQLRSTGPYQLLQMDPALAELSDQALFFCIAREFGHLHDRLSWHRRALRIAVIGLVALCALLPVALIWWQPAGSWGNRNPLTLQLLADVPALAVGLSRDWRAELRADRFAALQLGNSAGAAEYFRWVQLQAQQGRVPDRNSYLPRPGTDRRLQAMDDALARQRGRDQQPAAMPAINGAAPVKPPQRAAGTAPASVALQVLALTVDPKGRLRSNDLIDVVLRGAVLVDCALAGRIRDEPDQIALDATPTGFPPVDELLVTMRDHPDRPLDHWITSGKRVQSALAEQWLANGRWTVRRPVIGRPRYTDLDHTELLLSKRLLYAVADGVRSDGPAGTATAVLAALLGTLSALPFRCESDVVDSCGSAAWLVRNILDLTADLLRQAILVDDIAARQARPSLFN